MARRECSWRKDKISSARVPRAGRTCSTGFHEVLVQHVEGCVCRLRCPQGQRHDKAPVDKHGVEGSGQEHEQRKKNASFDPGGSISEVHGRQIWDVSPTGRDPKSCAQASCEDRGVGAPSDLSHFVFLLSSSARVSATRLPRDRVSSCVCCVL